MILYKEINNKYKQKVIKKVLVKLSNYLIRNKDNK
jgi:hypothetical protein